MSDLNEAFDVSIFEFPENVGLASCIINSLQEFSKDNDYLLILEDDIQLIDDQVINDIKFQFESCNFTGHINLWQPPGRQIENTISTGQHMWCWGWAADAELIREFIRSTEIELSKLDLFYLDFFGFDFVNHLYVNLTHRKKTWAIFYYIFLYKNKTDILNFNVSRVREISNCGTNRRQTIFAKFEKYSINLIEFLPFPLPSNVRYQIMFLLDLRLIQNCKKLVAILFFGSEITRIKRDITKNKLKIKRKN